MTQHAKDYRRNSLKPPTRRDVLDRLRTIRRLATMAEQLLTNEAPNPPAAVTKIRLLLNHCDAAKRSLRPVVRRPQQADLRR